MCGFCSQADLGYNPGAITDWLHDFQKAYEDFASVSYSPRGQMFMPIPQACVRTKWNSTLNNPAQGGDTAGVCTVHPCPTTSAICFEHGLWANFCDYASIGKPEIEMSVADVSYVKEFLNYLSHFH